MSRIVDQNGRPFNPFPTSNLLEMASVPLAQLMSSFSAPLSCFDETSRIAKLRKSCGVEPDPATVRRYRITAENKTTTTSRQEEDRRAENMKPVEYRNHVPDEPDLGHLYEDANEEHEDVEGHTDEPLFSSAQLEQARQKERARAIAELGETVDNARDNGYALAVDALQEAINLPQTFRSGTQ